MYAAPERALAMHDMHSHHYLYIQIITCISSNYIFPPYAMHMRLLDHNEMYV